MFGAFDVYITGGTGFIGRSLGEVLAARGAHVVSFDPRDQSLADVLRQGFESRRSVLVVCGWEMDRSSSMQEACLRSVETLVADSGNVGVPVVFISSMAVHAADRSNYGAAKLVAERVVLGSGGQCIRPGTVLANGVPSQGMAASVSATSIVARLALWMGQDFLVPVVEVDELVGVIEGCIASAHAEAGRLLPVVNSVVSLGELRRRVLDESDVHGRSSPPHVISARHAVLGAARFIASGLGVLPNLTDPLSTLQEVSTYCATEWAPPPK